MFREDRHWGRGHMQRTQRPSQRLNRRHHLRVLTVPPSLEVAERDDLDEIVERHRFLTTGFADFPVKFPPKRHKLFAQALLLVLASGAEIGAVRGARDPDDPMFAATDAADDSQGRTRPFALALFAIRALAHFVGPPSAGLAGGGMNP